MKVFITLWTHPSGDEVDAFATAELAEANRQAVASTNWPDEFPDDEPPADPKELADQYFERMGDNGASSEYFSVHEREVAPE